MPRVRTVACLGGVSLERDVPEEQIRSPIEHMACFSGEGGPWRLISFTAGHLPE